MSGIGEGRVVPAACPAALERCRQTRMAVEARIRIGQPIYGATTGVGAMKNVSWSASDSHAFNQGLVRAHHFGAGPLFPSAVVRTAIAIRVNTALTARTGCTTALIEAFLSLLERDVVPLVRRGGSVGCADIGLMGQIGAVLTGIGEAEWQGRRLPAAAALQLAGLATIVMEPRDGLASVSVNAVSYAAAAQTLRTAAAVARTLFAIGLASAGALGSSIEPWRAAVALGDEDEASAGAWLCSAARQWDWAPATRVHDPLSLRMMPQIFGAVFGVLETAGLALISATGRCDDNPVTIDGQVLTSGGSLPLSLTLRLEMAGTALAHAARNAFNRCVLLANGGSRGLPVNLVPAGAVATGLGPVVKLAAELYSRVLSVSSPVSAQSVVMAAGIEDEAVFLPLVVERIEQQVAALRILASVEALLASQAIDLAGDPPRGVPQLIHRLVRRHSMYLVEDRALSSELEALAADLTGWEAVRALVREAPLGKIDALFALDGD